MRSGSFWVRDALFSLLFLISAKSLPRNGILSPMLACRASDIFNSIRRQRASSGENWVALELGFVR